MSKKYVVLLVAALVFSRAAFADDAAIPPPPFPYLTTWFGNSFGGSDYVQRDAMGVGVSPDGTCFVPATWDEAHRGIGIYKDGKTVGRVDPDIPSAQGAAAVDSKYAFMGTFRYVGNVLSCGISRYSLNGKAAPWTTLATSDNPAHTDYFLTIGPGWQSGAALHGGTLYVTDIAANKVRSFDENTLIEGPSFACDMPFRLAVNAAGLIWVLKRKDTGTNTAVSIDEFSSDGTPTGKTIPTTEATGICFDNEGRLLVAGPDSRIVKYDVTGQRPQIVGALGIKGGVWAGVPGVNAPNKLCSPFDVGVDASDNIYVLSRKPSGAGGTDLREFAPDGKMRWQLVCTEFNNIGDFDRGSDGTSIYTVDSHYTMDFSRPTSQQWSWSGYTVDPKLDDVRASGKGPFPPAVVVRRLRGHLYLYGLSDYVSVFRKGQGDVFVPSVVLSGIPDWADIHNDHYPGDFPPGHPIEDKRWIWTDTNGNGKSDAGEFLVDPKAPASKGTGVWFDHWVDENGTVWINALNRADNKNHLWSLPMQGFDKVGNPIYTWASGKEWPLPPEMLGWDPTVIEYHAPADTMYIAALTKEHPDRFPGFLAATEILRYDNWSSGKPVLISRCVLPGDPKNQDYNIFCFSVAGRLVFAMERYLSQIHVYDNQTGKELGVMRPGPEVGGISGWNDNSRGIRAYQRSNGGYLVIAEEDYRAKQILYRIPPEGVAAAIAKENAVASP